MTSFTHEHISSWTVCLRLFIRKNGQTANPALFNPACVKKVFRIAIYECCVAIYRMLNESDVYVHGAKLRVTVGSFEFNILCWYTNDECILFLIWSAFSIMFALYFFAYIKSYDMSPFNSTMKNTCAFLCGSLHQWRNIKLCRMLHCFHHV